MNLLFGRTHGAPYRGYGTFRQWGCGGGGGTSFGEWEHNNDLMNLLLVKLSKIDLLVIATWHEYTSSLEYFGLFPR